MPRSASMQTTPMYMRCTSLSTESPSPAISHHNEVDTTRIHNVVLLSSRSRTSASTTLSPGKGDEWTEAIDSAASTDSESCRYSPRWHLSAKIHRPKAQRREGQCPPTSDVGGSPHDATCDDRRQAQSHDAELKCTETESVHWAGCPDVSLKQESCVLKRKKNNHHRTNYVREKKKNCLYLIGTMGFLYITVTNLCKGFLSLLWFDMGSTNDHALSGSCPTSPTKAGGDAGCRKHIFQKEDVSFTSNEDGKEYMIAPIGAQPPK